MSDRYILLVEDNADDELLARRALGRRLEGIRVEVAHDGAEALAALLAMERGSRPLPELLLLDLKLPKVSGLEVLRHVRSVAAIQVLPVVILSSSTEDRDVLDCYRAGANSYVRKPVEFDAFADAVGEIGSFWLGVNESPNREPG